MSIETFNAGVQYDDLKGSAAADRADDGDAASFLEERRLIRKGEFLVGIEAYVGTSTIRSGEDVKVSATFLIVETSTAGDAYKHPVRARKVSLELSPNEFFSLFKRFNVTLSNGGELEGREYEGVEGES